MYFKAIRAILATTLSFWKNSGERAFARKSRKKIKYHKKEGKSRLHRIVTNAYNT
jgi:hypothetical protein